MTRSSRTGQRANRRECIFRDGRDEILGQFHAEVFRPVERFASDHKPALRADINSGVSYGNVSICPVGDPAQ